MERLAPVRLPEGQGRFGLLAGPSAAMRALKLLAAQPAAAVWALLPALVALGLSVLGLYLAFKLGDNLLNQIWRDPGSGFWSYVWVVFAWLFRLGSALLALVVTPWLVMLVGFPLCEPMASRLDEALGGQAVNASLMHEIWLSLKANVGLILLGLLGSMLLFLLSFVPLLGLLTVPFSLAIWTPMFFAFDAYDSSLSRRQLRFRQKVALVLDDPVASISVGLTASVLVSVPGLNLVGLPVVVAMGVVAVRDLELAGRLPVPTP